jgi:hypothetical protein
LLLEAGLLLVLVPWSAFWDRNYFSETLPWLRQLMANGFVRGAVSGLGVLNLIAAIGELVDMFAGRGDRDHPLEEPPRLNDRHA